MSFSESVKTCLRKYAIFRGTASRPEYWWFFLFNALGASIFRGLGGNGLQGLWQLAMFLPGLSVAVRRLHDTGRSAWWLLTGFILPWLLILLCLRTKFSENPYATTGGGNTRGPTVSEADLVATPTYCPTCGKLRLPGQSYCVACGTRFPD